MGSTRGGIVCRWCGLREEDATRPLDQQFDLIKGILGMPDQFQCSTTALQNERGAWTSPFDECERRLLDMRLKAADKHERMTVFSQT